MATKRTKTAHAADGKSLPAVKLDLAAADQLDITGSSVAQETALDAELVIAFATGGNARIAWGATPSATNGAGSITVASGGWFAIVKEAADKIAVRGADGSTAGTVDLIPAKEA